MLRVVLSFAVCLIDNILLGDESCVYLFNLPEWASSNRHSLAANNAVPAFWADRRKGKAKMLAALKNNVTGNYDKCCLSRPRATARSLQRKSASCVKSATGSKLSVKESTEEIDWKQTSEGLTMRFTKLLPCKVAYGFKIKVNGRLDDSPREQFDDGIGRKGDWPVYNSER